MDSGSQKAPRSPMWTGAMTERALIIFRDNQLWIDDAGVYEPTTRFRAVLLREHFLERTREVEGMPAPLSARYAADCQSALAQYEQHQKEQQCVAAKA